MTTQRNRLLLIVALVVILPLNNVVTVVVRALNFEQIADWSCDVWNDSCPSNLQYDGICHANTVTECAGGDCGDCDLCGRYHEDCIGCLQHGCYYCGELGICTNSNQYSYDAPIIESGNNNNNYAASWCQLPTDFRQDSCNAPDSLFDDPFYSLQSWLIEQINIQDVWSDGITGEGIRIRVNDDSVDSSHPEFDGNNKFDVVNSCDRYLPQDGDRDSHGTIIASIAGGVGNNDVCGVGIAPASTLSACYALADPAVALSQQIDKYDISINAYGSDACQTTNRRNRRRRRAQDDSNCPFQNVPENVSFNNNPCFLCDFDSTQNEEMSSVCQTSIIRYCDDEENYERDLVGCIEHLDLFIKHGQCFYNSLEEAASEALATGVTQGRDGKGIIYVWAAGNTYHAGEDTNFQGFINTRLTIAVGSVGFDGLHSSFSTSGAALFVTAPGSDLNDEIGLFGANVGGTCEEVKGTSFSCAVVGGIIALMLQVNSELSWRDVQGILATTSRMVTNDPLDISLTTNGAGIKHSNFYGFGVVNAKGAVEAAKSWQLFGPEEMRMVESGTLDIEIPDDPESPIQSSLIVDAPISGEFFIVESVVVYLDVRHGSRGDLDIVLTSPSGTKSILSPGNRPETTQLYEDEQWKLLTVRSWGETSAGQWTLSIADISEGYVNEECFDYPWEGIFADELGSFELDCVDAMKNRWCVNGQVVNAPDEFINKRDDTHNRSPAEACCVCGGGTTNPVTVDRLVQWRLVLYGRTLGSAPTVGPDDPTPSPLAGIPVPPAWEYDESSSGGVGRTPVIYAFLYFVGTTAWILFRTA